MRTWRGSVRFVFAALAGLFGVGSARAQLLVVATPGQPAVAFAELAYAEGEGPPVTWLSLRVQRGPVAIVAALPAGAQVEPGLDAWLAALEATASPNILLPRDTTSSCFQPASYAHVAWPRGKGVPPTELALQSSEDALAALDEQGLELSGELPVADRYLIWSWTAPDSDQTTSTLRIVGGTAPLALLPGAAFPVLVNSVTRGSRALPSELGDDALSVTFVADKRARSDYRERLRDFFGSRSDPLLETRARGPLFDWSLYEDTVSLASLTRNYASIAVKELPGLDDAKCAEQLGALRKADAPSPSACGSALDASLALRAAGAELPTLQRFAVSGVSGFAPGEATAGGMASAPVLRARLLDESACASTEPVPIVVHPPARNGGGSSTPPSGNTTVVVEETVVVDDTPPAEVSCGSSPQPEPQDGYYSDDSSSDSCYSDTSSSSEADSSSGCSSDTSSSSSSDDSGCASDTSSSSSSDDNGCASDTSSSSASSSDTSCDGSDGSSSYDGDTCTGAAAPGAEPTDKARASLTSGSRAHRPRRTKTSLWAMAFAAVVLPIRRRKRGHGASG